MRRLKELNKTADDTSLDDLLDGRITLLGEKLAELGCGLDLKLNLI